MGRTVEQAFEAACEKILVNSRIIGKDLREFVGRHEGDYFTPPRESLIDVAHIFGWTQSFFTGMAGLAYKHTHNPELMRWMYQFYTEYEDKVNKTPQDTMHDIGFLYTLYSTIAYQITGDIHMKELSVQAARVLCGRYVPNGGYIQAWGRMDGTIPDYVDEKLAKDNFFSNSKGLAILDCMMNIPLLFWATKETGTPFYHRVAVEHANTTLKYFVRDDDTVCHAYRFNLETGEPMEEFNDCGFSEGSHWARGTAWAVYGFAIAYRYTGDKKYYDTAVALAKKFISLCNKDGMPIWDFRLPADKPAVPNGRESTWADWDRWDITDAANTDKNIDTSAAAIVCCGLYELQQVEKDEEFAKYTSLVVDSLIEKYLNFDMSVPGLLSRQGGPDQYASFGDYYAMELLAQQLPGYESVW